VSALGSWSFALIAQRARELRTTTVKDDVFELLLEEVYPTNRRVPKLVMSLVGKAVHETDQETLDA